MYLVLLGIVLASLIYLKIIKPYLYWTDRSVKQRKQFYLLGDLAGVILGKETLHETIRNIYREFPEERYVGVYQMLNPILFIRDADLVKQITVKDFDHFVDHKAPISEDVETVWSKNLFVLKGDEWRDMRATLSPSFTTSKMKMIFNLVSECASEYNNNFLGKGEDVVTLELKDTFTRYTNDIIATVAFGLKCNSLIDENNEFYLKGKHVTNFTGFSRIMRFFLIQFSPRLCKAIGLKLFPSHLTDYFVNIIRETIKYRESRGIVRPDMLNLLLEAKRGRANPEDKKEESPDTGFATAKESSTNTNHKFDKKPITDLDITAQALVFFLAGFETVSTYMCFLAYELAVNEDIQRRLQNEVDETLEQCDGKLTYEALVKMKYLDMVVSEVLRKWSPGIITDRVCVKPYTIEPTKPTETAVHLNVGDVVWIPVAGFHWDPEYFPSPEVLDPERFSDGNKSKVNPYTYMPFGAGPRNCIGSRFALLESKTILFYLLSKFNLVVVDKTPIPLKLKRSLTLAVADGLWIGLKARTHYLKLNVNVTQ